MNTVVLVAMGAVTILVLVVLGGVANYSVQQRRARRIHLQWFDPHDLVDIDGLLTHVRIQGEGTPLILVHGSQMNMYDWRFNVDFFARYFRVYALDMVGCGFTEEPDANYSPAFYSAFIYGVLEHFGIPKASFVASSWGGGHVFYFALQHPEMVERLVMSSPCGLPHKMAVLDRILATPILGTMAALYGNRALVRSQLLSAFANPDAVGDDLVDAVYKPLFMPGGLRAMVRSYRQADFSFVQDNLERIEPPVLLVWGSRDSIHPRWMLDEMKRRLPTSEALVVENAGHLPHEEASDEFNRCALAFLTGKGRKVEVRVGPP
jgi:2-hydroxy-6-oxonona-2,4-dienedioate hydrolase